MPMEPRPPLPPNRSVPPAVVIPVLYYPDVRAAVDWLSRAFGFVERLQIEAHRAQLMFEGGALIVADRGEQGPAEGWRTHSILLRVTDADRLFAQAISGGATVVMAPADQPFGERQCTVLDPGGHRWTLSQTIGDSDPASWGGVLKEPT